MGCAGCPTPAKTTVEPTPTASPSAGESVTPLATLGPIASPTREKTGAGPMPLGHPNPEDGIPGTDRLRTLALTLGSSKLEVWVADTRASRQLGLMHVKSMPESSGMLFVYPASAQRAFWMENTYVPLSLAYVRSDGTIDQILDMEPFSRRTHPSSGVIRLVLEVNQGWFARHKVQVGDKIPGIEGLIGY
ncbi:MAG: DUF192 domain-containing protein [Planctomycetes bacterium]|nr:DUF192 domain-containing protein [Planctomycetota bacterium]